MKIPTIKGIIDRRILINYQVDPAVLAAYLPSPFQPQVINGKGIVGICLIRLQGIRPKGFPAFLGVQSENGAHRVAVEWPEKGVLKTGVYIPRRDTSAHLNAWAGGFIFPGVHHLASFKVKEASGSYEVGFTSQDNTRLFIRAHETDNWSTNSVFKNKKEASDFFEKDSLGYSPSGDKYDGLLLKTYNWEATPLAVDSVQSSFFENRQIFPADAIRFDNALLMRNIEHEWQAAPVIMAQ